MPASTVHVGVALLLAVGLLGRSYDRRAILVVLVVLVLPESDALAGFAMDGAHRTLFHTLVTVPVAAALLLWETRRDGSWLRGRFGASGVRVAWVALFVHAFAHLALDWAHLDGINALWPLRDRFFRLEGAASLSTTDGFVQTFVEVATDPETGDVSVDAGGGGTRAETHVSTPAQPSPDPDPGPVDRRVPIAVGGWQLYLIGVGLFAVVARRLQSPLPSEEGHPRGRDDARDEGRRVVSDD